MTDLPTIAALAVVVAGLAMRAGFRWSRQQRESQKQAVSPDCRARIVRDDGRKGDSF